MKNFVPALINKSIGLLAHTVQPLILFTIRLTVDLQTSGEEAIFILKINTKANFNKKQYKVV